MRNARRSGGTLVEQAELASDTVFAAHHGARPVEALLLEYDGGTGRVKAIDTGSPLAWRIRGGAVAPMVLDQQLPLGMFEETRYGVQNFEMAVGDRLFVASDGVHSAAPGGRDSYGRAAPGGGDPFGPPAAPGAGDRRGDERAARLSRRHRRSRTTP